MYRIPRTFIKENNSAYVYMYLDQMNLQIGMLYSHKAKQKNIFRGRVVLPTLRLTLYCIIVFYSEFSQNLENKSVLFHSSLLIGVILLKK